MVPISKLVEMAIARLIEEGVHGNGSENKTRLAGIERMMKRLTVLKAEQHTMSDCYGQSPYDGEIKGISEALDAFSVKWRYNEREEAEIIE